MQNLKMLPFKMGSQSSKELAQLLEITRVRPDGRYVPKVRQTILNWGYAGEPVWERTRISRNVRMLNHTSAVNIAGNKKMTLEKLRNAGVSVPDFTSNMSVAQTWSRAGFIVFERHNLRGNSGEGIRVVKPGESLSSSPLYTKYIPKTKEFRVHVFNGQVIDYIEKKRVREEERGANFNQYISSIHQGWVFQRTNVEELASVKSIAIKGVSALGLDFGAVDIIYYDDVPFILEINTAPGLQGITLTKYANALRAYMGVGELSHTVVSRVVNQTVEPTRSRTAAVSASASRRSAPVPPVSTRPVSASPAWVPAQHAMDEQVTLTMSRADALRLKSLLASIS